MTAMRQSPGILRASRDVDVGARQQPGDHVMLKKIGLVVLVVFAAFLLFSYASVDAGIRYGDFPPPGAFVSNDADQGR
jgi:hypothetical protein